ncbi:MAG: hypothetical protein HFF54_04540 [Lawsonibacter sp.]|nr:hypothetical protein [Lawsonibacter sp.]
MKKISMALLISLVLLLPAGGTALAGHAEAPAPGEVQEFLPGSVPAETGAAESMSPALHALVLACLDQEAARFDLDDRDLAWEGLYIMLSLYGQMDSRSVTEEGELFLPEETVQDYAAALDLDLEELGEPPAAIRDRLNYDSASRCFVVVCGSDDLARIQVDSAPAPGGGLSLAGALVYEAEDRILARFQAELQPRDNMFGYAITAMDVS